MTTYGYAKVPPKTPAGVLEELGWWLRWYGCTHVITDVGQGGKLTPGWRALLERVQNGDTVMLLVLSTRAARDVLDSLIGKEVTVHFLPSPLANAS
ncbi:recombinase family protein [Amycolatopsis pittospori]|uniref:hypothetical protein n=1 Tax=Amycolatopsis pittospori TaxID=2749434 RepID=UPI0015F080F4|nr:hypothetical protein [Amycolatopsis pittospori]